MIEIPKFFEHAFISWPLKIVKATYSQQPLGQCPSAVLCAGANG